MTLATGVQLSSANQASHGDGYCIAASPPFRNRACFAALHGEARPMISVKLRNLRHQDKEAVISMLRDPRVMRFLGPRRALAEDEADSWFESTLTNPTRFAVANADTDEFIGVLRH